MHPLRLLALGGVSGAIATAVMSAVMIVARRAGLMSELPPHEIASRSVDRTTARDEAGPDERRGLGWITHFGFGAGAGALYALLRNIVRTPGPAWFHGAGYAVGVWFVSYMGWLPALGLMPRADRDERERQPAMVAAHLVFGAVLGMLVQPRLPWRRRAAGVEVEVEAT
jgi:hypothetical protein